MLNSSHEQGDGYFYNKKLHLYQYIEHKLIRFWDNTRYIVDTIVSCSAMI